MKEFLIKNKLITTIVAIILSVLIVGGVTIAYLTDFFENDDTGTVGTVGVELYQNTTLISGIFDQGEYTVGNPPIITLGNMGTPVAVNLNVKNSGNINILVRVWVRIVFVVSENQEDLISTADLSVSSTGFVNNYTDTSSYNDYFAYYNSVLAPNSTATFATNLTPLTTTYANQDVVVYLRADAISYSGNYYKLDDAGYPVDPGDDPWLVPPAFLTTWTAWE